MKKFREILKGTNFDERINLVIDNAKNNWLRDLGKNDFIHSQKIEENLDRLVPDNIKIDENVFEKGEIFLLLYSVYLHDIGRGKDVDNHEKETYNEIIAAPDKYGLRNQFEAKAVAEICYGHAKELDKPIMSIPDNYGIDGISKNRTTNLRFLAALLRLADEVDNSFTRVQGIKSQDGSIRNLIRFVNFDTNRWIIEFQSEPSTWKDWFELRNLRKLTQKRLDEIKNILESKGLYYYQIFLDPKDFSKIQPSLTKDMELEELKRIVGGLLSENSEYGRTCGGYSIDIYFEEKIKGQIYRNVLYVKNEIDEDSLYGYKEIFKNLKSNDDIERGFIVVEKITEDLIRVAKTEKIEIFTIKDLINNVVDFSKYLEKYIKQYEDKPIFKNDYYIPLSGTLETKENIGIIDDYLNQWLRSEGQVQLTILGDYGSGKSTIAERFAYYQAKRFVDSPEKERIPILVELKNYRGSIEDLITNSLYGYINKNFNDIKTINESGRLILILEGFDEMPQHNIQGGIFANFREIDKLISERSKIILTSRSHFFKNQDEIYKLHEGTEVYNKIDGKSGYSLFNINPFKEDDLIKYLKKRLPENWEKYHKIIINTYNLLDLAEKPILLELIVETLPKLKIEIDEKLNHASLYDSYTKFWLHRDDWRSYLTSNDRELISQEIAFYFFIQGENEINYTYLPEIIKNQFPKSIYNIQSLDQDIRTCTFLKRDEKGNYSFVHKSFMEFFVAKKFAKEFIINKTNNFKMKKLSTEIAKFMVNMVDNKEIFYEFIRSTKNASFSEVGYLGGNSATILNFLGENFIEIDFSSTVLVGANFNNANLEKSNLQKTIFYSDMPYKIEVPIYESQSLSPKYTDKGLVNFDTFSIPVSDILVSWSGPSGMSGLSSNIVYRSAFNDFYINDTTFIKANLRMADLRKADLRGVDFSNAHLRFAKLNHAKLHGTSFENADLRGANLTNTILQKDYKWWIQDHKQLKGRPKSSYQPQKRY